MTPGNPRATVGAMAQAGRALFLDWGGTLARVVDGATLLDAAGDPVLESGVAEALARARPAWDACFIASNQARIGRGLVTADEVLRRFRVVDRRLGGVFTDWRLCPHQDEDGCACRKPRPGMFLDLARAHDIDLARSCHVGDSPKDRDAAAAAGIGRFVWARDFFGW